MVGVGVAVGFLVDVAVVVASSIPSAVGRLSDVRRTAASMVADVSGVSSGSGVAVGVLVGSSVVAATACQLKNSVVLGH